MVFALIAGSVVSSFLFKDQLIDHFIREANKHLNTPISINKISVSALDNFPSMTLNFDGVIIEESFEGSSYPLLEAEKIQFTFDPISIYRGNYTIEQIHISNASCHLKIDKEGNNNYQIIKRQDSTSDATVKMNLSKVKLESVDFKYSNYQNDIYIDTKTSKTTAKIDIKGQLYEIMADGDYFVNKIQSKEVVILENKALHAKSNLDYYDDKKHVDFKQSELNIEGSSFITHGNYVFLETPEVEWYLEGHETNLKTRISLLPEETAQQLSKYESLGDVYFDLSLKGKIDYPKMPSLTIEFGLLEAALLYPEKNIKIEKANAEGLYYAASLNELSKGKLELRNVTGILEGELFNGSLIYDDFDNPFMKLAFNGKLDINSILKFIDQKQITEAKGLLEVDLNLVGDINDLKKKETAQNVKTSGEIITNGLSLKHNDLPLRLDNINGNLLFNNNDLAISDVSGRYGESDFLLNGFFKNIIAFLLFKNEPVGIEADLKSKYINLDELLADQQKTRPTASSSEYNFSISPRLILKFNCNVDRLSFRHFQPKSITGDLKIKNQVAFTDKLTFDAMGGKIGLSGMVDTTIPDGIQVTSSFNVDAVNIDSIFYVFENFNQSFLEDKHLKGKIMADVQTEMELTKQLRLKPESLTATINTSIIGGELNNFEPMQKLAKYVDEEKLDHLTFSELQNEIFVENQTIYLPQMEVSSNVTDIKISGTHTFDRKIDYRVIAPLRSRAKIDPDEAFGAIEEDTEGRSMLYLKIIGTTDDYKIVYDKEGVKQKIASDLKKEIQELKDAFKNKGLDKNKTIELEEDDYFDWEEDDGRE